MFGKGLVWWQSFKTFLFVTDKFTHLLNGKGGETLRQTTKFLIHHIVYCFNLPKKNQCLRHRIQFATLLSTASFI
jgi:hypothetical protein